MYEQFFGLRERPFDLTSNPRYLVLTGSHREVLSNLEDGMGTRKGMTLLVGEAGSGKSTLIRAAIERLPARVHCVYLRNSTLTRSDFVEMLAEHFGLSDAAARLSRGETTALVVDEAHSLPTELLEEIRLLASIDTNSEPLIRVVIAGQPELADRINSPDLRQLKQRISLRCDVRPLRATDAAAYVAGRIQAAGGAGAQVFTREAVADIGEYSRGFPRLINVIADNALLGGFAADERPVGSEIVREVCRDLDIEGVPARSSRRAVSPPPVERQPPVPVPATIDVPNGSLSRALAATPTRLSFFSRPGEDVVQVGEDTGPPRPSQVVAEVEPVPVRGPDVAAMAVAPLPEQIVQQPAAPDAAKLDGLSPHGDSDVKEIFFNTYFEKTWNGPQ